MSLPDVNNINLGTQTTINTNSLDDQKKILGRPVRR